MTDTLNREEAESVVTYRCAIRTKLNELEAAAKISHSGKFELKNGAASNAADLLSKISSLVPVFGQPASAVFSLASFGAKQLENINEKAAAEKILALNCADSTEWNSLTKQLSRELGTHRTEELRNLDKESAEELAKADLAKIVAKILTGDLRNIEGEQNIFEALKTAAIAPNALTKPISYQSASRPYQLQQAINDR
jgi:hypothetical protein